MNTREAWDLFLQGELFDQNFLGTMIEEYQRAYSLLVNHPDALANFVLSELDFKRFKEGSYSATTKCTGSYWKAFRRCDHVSTKWLQVMLVEVEEATDYLQHHPYASALAQVVVLDRRSIESYLRQRKAR